VASHCDESGQACTWLGIAGEFGLTEDGDYRLDTKLYWTMDMSFAADGTVWFIDWNNIGAAVVALVLVRRAGPRLRGLLLRSEGAGEGPRAGAE
jgi:hypothetical protein